MIYYLTMIILTIFLIFIIQLKRKNIIDKLYAYLWMTCDLILLFICVFPGAITRLSLIIGVYYRHTVLVLIGFLILGIYCFYISIVISKYKKIIVKLTQEVALIKNKYENKN